MISGGCFLIGVGEWKNHKVASWFKEANLYTGGPALMSATLRRPDFVGIVFDLAGVGLIANAVWKIYHG